MKAPSITEYSITNAGFTTRRKETSRTDTKPTMALTISVGRSSVGGRNMNVAAADRMRTPIVMADLVMTSSTVITWPAGWAGCPYPGCAYVGCP